MRDATFQILNEIAVERYRQEAGEGYTTEHDDGHTHSELGLAAASYALAAAAKLRSPAPTDLWRASHEAWPFAESAKHKHAPRRLFIIAICFLVAEIERLDRAAGRPGFGEVR